MSLAIIPVARFSSNVPTERLLKFVGSAIYQRYVLMGRVAGTGISGIFSKGHF
jgi:hypothetical protein